MKPDACYFSHVELRPERSDAQLMRRLLAGGGYGLHQSLWRLFAPDPSAKRDFLYHRIDGNRLAFYFVSARELIDDGGCWRVRSKPYAPQIVVGDRFTFTLRANPVIARGREAGGKGRALRHDVVLDARRTLPDASEAERVELAGTAWLSGRDGHRAATHGYAVESVHADRYTQHRLHKPGADHAITFSTLDYAGTLRVTDADLFGEALTKGIGPAKGFGCGLLLVRRL